MLNKLYPPVPDFQPLSRGAQSLLSPERWAQYIVAEHAYQRALARREDTEEWVIGALTVAILALVLVAL